MWPKTLSSQGVRVVHGVDLHMESYPWWMHSSNGAIGGHQKCSMHGYGMGPSAPIFLEPKWSGEEWRIKN